VGQFFRAPWYGRGKVPRPRPGVSIYNFHAATPEAVDANYALGKVIGDNETGGSKRDDRTYRAQGWEFILAGGGLFSHLDFSFATSHPRGTFVDHKGPGGGSPALRRQLGILKRFIHGFDFLSMEPAPSIVKGPLPDAARIRTLAGHGKQYAIYLSGGGQVDLRLDLPAGHYLAEWVDTLEGDIERSVRIDHAGGVATLSSPPFKEDIALRVVRQEK